MKLLRMTMAEMISLLTDQARTLRVLHLEAIELLLYDDGMEDADEMDPDGTALNFLLLLKNDLSLEYLRMSHLSDENDRTRLIGGHDDTWVGAEEIQDGLQVYIQREEDEEYSVDEEAMGDDFEGEWITVRHSEDEDEDEYEDGDEVRHDGLHDGNDGATTQ